MWVLIDFVPWIRNAKQCDTESRHFVCYARTQCNAGISSLPGRLGVLGVHFCGGEIAGCEDLQLQHALLNHDVGSSNQANDL